jgi:hypothetical protein
MKKWIIALALAGVSCLTSSAAAQPIGSSYTIIAPSAQREVIKSTHILDRPNRPGHFYGNTVRRRHYGGTMALMRRRR